MTRGAGRKRNVPRQPVPGDPEAAEIGLSVLQDPAGSPIPGLTGNIINHETVRQQVPTADETFDEYRGMMAHGVPNDSQSTEERALMERDGTLAQHNPPTPPELGKPITRPPAIPVYLTTPAAGGNPLGTMATRKITVPGTGNDPIRIAARDLDRTEMLILVETNPGQNTSTVTTGSATDPGAGGAVAAYTSSLPAGTYQVTANVYVSGTVTAADGNNMEVFATGATPVTLIYPGVANSPTTTTFLITTTSAGPWNILAKTAASGAAAVYNGSLSITPVGVQAAPTGVRIDREVSTLSAGFGALLSTENNSYIRLDNQQDELFALSNDADQCVISVIYLYEEPAAD